jgi:hypothetical protein
MIEINRRGVRYGVEWIYLKQNLINLRDFVNTVINILIHRDFLVGICGEQSGTGACFIRVLRFPLPIIIPPISPSS